MRTIFFAILFFAFVQGFIVLDSVWGGNVKISNESAIAIAKHEATRLGYEVEFMNIEATLYRTHWNRYLPQDSTSEYDLERQNSLKGRIYWAICYSPTASEAKGGDVCIFIDSETGKILADYRGE